MQWIDKGNPAIDGMHLFAVKKAAKRNMFTLDGGLHSMSALQFIFEDVKDGNIKAWWF